MNADILAPRVISVMKHKNVNFSYEILEWGEFVKKIKHKTYVDHLEIF